VAGLKAKFVSHACISEGCQFTLNMIKKEMVKKYVIFER
jgi:hypothetical protein